MLGALTLNEFELRDGTRVSCVIDVLRLLRGGPQPVFVEIRVMYPDGDQLIERVRRDEADLSMLHLQVFDPETYGEPDGAG